MTNNHKPIKIPSDAFVIDAAPDGEPLPYKDLNQKIHNALDAGKKHLFLQRVCGQRFIGAAVRGSDVKIEIEGIPGNDLGIFMDGPEIIVHNNAEDQVGNTMNAGTIVVHGHVGDVIGLSARGGNLFVRGNAGFRCGIHVKEYKDQKPTIVIGGAVKDYFGEYMAGGVLIALGMEIDAEGNIKDLNRCICGNCLGTGIHNGKIFLRTTDLPKHLLGIGAKVMCFTEEDKLEITPLLKEFCRRFGSPMEKIWSKPFIKVVCESNRPFHGNYCTQLV